MDQKSQIRITLLTAITLLEGFAPQLKLDPRIIVAIQLAKHLVEDHWSEIWALGQKNSVFASLWSALPDS